MIVVYFVVAGLLAAVNLAVGVLKLVRSRQQLQAMGQAWTEDVSTPVVKLIGAAEVLGAVGLIVPMATGILPVLSPVAAIGIAILQVGAFVTHARRAGERRNMVGNMVLFALAGAAAVIGFLHLAALSGV